MYANSLYGQTLYSVISSDTDAIQDYIDLMPYLPDYYQENNKMIELQTLLGYKVGEFRYKVWDTFNQSFISTSTWGLDRWEKVFGITTEKSRSYVMRREILMAKLRGSGTTTKEMIKNVAVAFSGGEVAILEYPEECRFEVQFIGVKGIPQNLAGLINAIEEIKPAHLSYSFKYTYTIWGSLNGLIWDGISQKTWDELKIYKGE